MQHEAHRKERFIITTIEIIDELGIQKLSTREIARRQGVSEATLFRHYRSKNDLLLAVLDYYDQFSLDIFRSTIQKELKPVEKIRYLLNVFAQYFENYPAVTSLLQILDSLRHEADLADKTKTILENNYKMFYQLIEEAQKAGEISADADCEILSEMIVGFWREMCLNWRFKGYMFSLKERLQASLEMFL